MRIKVIYEKREYLSKEITSRILNEYYNDFYNFIEITKKFRMELDNGSFFVIGKDAIQKSVFIFLE